LAERFDMKTRGRDQSVQRTKDGRIIVHDQHSSRTQSTNNFFLSSRSPGTLVWSLGPPPSLLLRRTCYNSHFNYSRFLSMGRGCPAGLCYERLTSCYCTKVQYAWRGSTRDLLSGGRHVAS